MFWGLVVEPGKRYEQTVDKSFHLSKAVLEVNKDDSELVSVILEYDGQDYLLCHLQKDKVFQTSLDLHFKAGDTIAFCHSGKSSVHLSGYVTDEFDLESSDEDDEEEEEPSPVKKDNSGATAVKKRKEVVGVPSPKAKKAKVEVQQQQQEEDDDDEDDEDFQIGEEDSDLEGDEVGGGEEEEDSDSDEDSDDDDEEEEEQPTPAKSKKGVQIDQKTPLGKVQQGQKDKNQTPQSKKKNKQQQQQLTPSNEQNGVQSGKKLKPFPGTPKEGGKPDTPGPQDSSPKKTLQGGVIIEDVKQGNGPVAKPGRQVAVYYVGRLKQSNKQFDSTTQGPGFKFNLGRSEVIKGWDIGVAGMRVGGKRRITCPPHMAYGKKGQPPVIPPNSTLVFEVELKNVH